MGSEHPQESRLNAPPANSAQRGPMMSALADFLSQCPCHSTTLNDAHDPQSQKCKVQMRPPCSHPCSRDPLALDS
jgi:hypothetical protein